ncbi:hypothetical protein H4R26_001595 [Coemansia thaxteri]|uniref:Charged multivesicular body protein 7 n=1 Tax=Coemansia thaxteri TaxID=2663907 RepID=A0A9W8EGR9_9FUNG|nr:hypothetical protein H4R26_001595 [Coemansia thaxteri]
MEEFLASLPQLTDPDQRAFLYSDLERQKTDNPDGYSEAVDVWTRIVLAACQRGLLSADKESDGQSVLTICPQVLASRLVFRGDTPMGLGSAVNAMERVQTLQAADTYLAPRGFALRRWAGWVAARLLGSSPPTCLVAPSLVRAAAARILEAHYERASCPVTDHIMSIDEFRHAYCAALSADCIRTMNVVDTRLVLKHLADAQHIAADLPAASAQDHSSLKGLVKFAPTKHPASLALTEADRAAYQVVCTHRLLEQQVAALEARLLDLGSLVRQALTRQQRPLAAAHLRTKRHMESDVLPKRLAALDTVNRIVLQLQQTSSDIQVMQTLSAGTLALKHLNGIAQSLDHQSVVDAWEDEAMRAADLDAALEDVQSAVAADHDLDDADVEAELDALIAEESALDALADTMSKAEIAQEETQEQTSEEPQPVVPEEPRVGQSPPLTEVQEEPPLSS